MKKLQAIKHLVKYGSRNSEWQEAGLLHKIEEIIDSEKEDFSSKEIQQLIEDAKKF